jgi:hypothetical protein
MPLTTRRLFVSILFIALFVMTTREISDPDFWWHLSTGKYIVETHTIPHADIFSFTNAGRPWVTHEWLAEIFIFALYALGSFPLLILIFAALMTLAFALVYLRSPGQPYIAAFAVMLAALATAPMWGVRPQMLSLLLTSVFLWILDRKGRSIWLLPCLMLFWVNLHSGYALGIVIVGVYVFAEIIAGFNVQSSRFEVPSLGFSLLFVFVLCIIAVLFNPNGATMYIYPFETLTSPTMQAYIQEWFSPDFHLSEFQPFAWLLLATLAAIAVSGKRTSFVQTILLIGFGYAALRSARHIPLYAIIAAPIIAEHVWHVIKSHGWVNSLNTHRQMTRVATIVNWILLTMMVLAGIARVAIVLSNQTATERARFPAAATDFIQAQKIKGGIYNTYAWGGYLIWRMYPQARVFIDGRADVYGDAFIENVYLKAYRGGVDWREPLDRYDVRVVLIEPNAPLAAQLAREAPWKQVYGDQQAIVYVR